VVSKYDYFDAHSKQSNIPEEFQLGVRRFSHQYNSAVRAIDGGLTREQMVEKKKLPYRDDPREDVRKRAYESAVRSQRAITKMFDEVSPTMPEALTLRGESMTPAARDLLATQDEFTLGRTTSTTIDPETALSFMRNSYSSERSARVLLRLKQRSGIAIREWSRYPDENEILMPAWARFRVIGRSMLPDGGMVVDAEEIERDEVTHRQVHETAKTGHPTVADGPIFPY
jgi:hypothetical protein